MPKDTNHLIKIGIIVGAGTGRQLSDIFKDFLTLLVTRFSKYEIKFVEDLKKDGTPYIYHSYQSLINAVNGDINDFNTKSRNEVTRLLRLTKQWNKDGVLNVFRTSINAEALYMFRQKVKAVKVFGIETTSGKKIFFVRDQAEGFYANTSYLLKDGGDTIMFRGKLSKSHHQRIVKFANSVATNFLGIEYHKWAIYKCHLFGNLIEGWLKEADDKIVAYQPDNGLTNLMRIVSENGGSDKSALGKLLVLCSNEVGDLIYESILGTINVEAKTELYSRNYYTAEPFCSKFVEYQTVHGSADDIEGTDNILPFATLRIAVHIAEDSFEIFGIKNALEYAISEVKRQGIKGTQSIVNEIQNHLKSNFNYEK